MGEAIRVLGEGSLAVETFTPAGAPPVTVNLDSKTRSTTGRPHV